MCAHLPTAFHCNLQLQFKGVPGSAEGLKIWGCTQYYKDFIKNRFCLVNWKKTVRFYPNFRCFEFYARKERRKTTWNWKFTKRISIFLFEMQQIPCATTVAYAAFYSSNGFWVVDVWNSTLFTWKAQEKNHIKLKSLEEFLDFLCQMH